MCCIYASGQTYRIQPKRYDICISKQTSSGLPACSPGFEDVLIKLLIAKTVRQSKIITRMNFRERTVRPNNKKYTYIQYIYNVSVCISVEILVIPLSDSAHAHKYVQWKFRRSMLICLWNRWRCLLILCFWRLPWQQATTSAPSLCCFCTATAWCKTPSFPSHHLFYSHRFPFIFPTCFNHFFHLDPAGQTFLSLRLSCLQQFFFLS